MPMTPEQHDEHMNQMKAGIAQIMQIAQSLMGEEQTEQDTEQGEAPGEEQAQGKPAMNMTLAEKLGAK